ncbi:MAG: S8 family serine peptidase [Deltaproteobacteria bacterium]|nr:S8 family serine peptidase [Deltaproteobacteria bacterium]
MFCQLFLQKVSRRSPFLLLYFFELFVWEGWVFLRPEAAADVRSIDSDNIFAEWLAEYESGPPVWWFEMVKGPGAFRVLAFRDTGRLSDRRLVDQAPVIVIIDSGVDEDHPSLKGKLWQNPRPGAAGCFRDKWGCNVTQSFPGMPFGMGPARPPFLRRPGESCPGEKDGGGFSEELSCRHGTMLAALVAGDIRNGIPGMCPLCKIFPVRIVRDSARDGRSADSELLKAFRYVRKLRESHAPAIRIVAVAYGKFSDSREMQAELRALDNSGILVIAAAGNAALQDEVYPAAYPTVLSVTALGRDGRKSWFSNFGPWVDIAAPGGNSLPEDDEETASQEMILSAVPGGAFALAQGSSIAVPIVAALAGLVLTIEPGLSAADLKQRLIQTADQNLYGEEMAGGANQIWLRELSDQRMVRLLGAGLPDAVSALKGDTDGKAESEEETDPVFPVCGVIGHRQESSFRLSALLLSFLLILPFLAGAMSMVCKRLMR